MAGKKTAEKLTIQEYQALKKERLKKGFRFYPWPVLAALCVPLAVFIFLVIYSTIHIRSAQGLWRSRILPSSCSSSFR